MQLCIGPHCSVAHAGVGIEGRGDRRVFLQWEQRLLLLDVGTIDHLPRRVLQLQLVGVSVVARVLQQDCVVDQLQLVKLVPLPALVHQPSHVYVTDITGYMRLLS